MDTTDPYTHRRLLYKSDPSIAKVYTNAMLMYPQTTEDQQKVVNQEETLKEIDMLIFQIFKYKTALNSLQKDLHINTETQSQADIQIELDKEEIKQLTGQVKTAESVRKRKLEWNEVANSLKEFDRREVFDDKIKKVEQEVLRLEEEYKQEMEVCSEKERCLKIALSALRVLMREDGAAGGAEGGSPIYSSQPLKDGQSPAFYYTGSTR